MHFEITTSQAKENPNKFKERFLKQITEAQKSNSFLNCFLNFTVSLENIDQTFPLIKKNKHTSPLFGLTLAVKDCFSIKNHPLSWGLNPPVDHCASEHAEALQQLLNLGLSLSGSTNLDDACLGISGLNSFFGRVNQPFFKERIPCGSSSGSAAAVAAALVDLGLGSDLAGSIRAPAAACCVSAIRCSSSLFSKKRSMLLESSLDSVGLLTKKCEDLFFTLKTISKEKFEVPSDYSFIIPSNREMTLIDQSTESKFNKAIEQVSSNFKNCQSEELGFSACSTLIKELIAMDFAEKVANYNNLNLPESAIALLALRESRPEFKREEFRERHSVFKSNLRSLLGSNQFILTPTLPYSPPAWKTLRREKKKLDNLNYFLTLANMADLPAISFILEKPTASFPLSLQLIGPAGKDLETAYIASELQQSFFKSYKN